MAHYLKNEVELSIYYDQLIILSGDEININYESGAVKDAKKTFTFAALPEKLVKVFEAKGLVNFIKENALRLKTTLRVKLSDAKKSQLSSNTGIINNRLPDTQL